MTREETIEFGKMWLQINEDAKDSDTYNFFKFSIEALEQGQTDVVAGEHIDPEIESEATIVSTTKQTYNEPIPSKLTLKVFLAALFGSMLGGGIIAAVAILLQKFL